MTESFVTVKTDLNVQIYFTKLQSQTLRPGLKTASLVIQSKYCTHRTQLDASQVHQHNTQFVKPSALDIFFKLHMKNRNSPTMISCFHPTDILLRGKNCQMPCFGEWYESARQPKIYIYKSHFKLWARLITIKQISIGISLKYSNLVVQYIQNFISKCFKTGNSLKSFCIFYRVIII